MGNLVKIQSQNGQAFWINRSNLPGSLKNVNQGLILIDEERYKELRFDLWDYIVNRCWYCYYYNLSNSLIPCRKRDPIFSTSEANSIGIDCNSFKNKED